MGSRVGVSHSGVQGGRVRVRVLGRRAGRLLSVHIFDVSSG